MDNGVDDKGDGTTDYDDNNGDGATDDNIDKDGPPYHGVRRLS